MHERHTILIDQIKNTTNISIPLESITTSIQYFLKNNKIKSIPLNKVVILSNNDNSINFTGKTVIIARYINANYILYTDIYEYLNNYKIRIQLVEVTNGEIVCTNSINIIKFL